MNTVFISGEEQLFHKELSRLYLLKKEDMFSEAGLKAETREPARNSSYMLKMIRMYIQLIQELPRGKNIKILRLMTL